MRHFEISETPENIELGNVYVNQGIENGATTLAECRSYDYKQ